MNTADTILLLVAIGSFVLPITGVTLSDLGWKRLSDIDGYGLIFLSIALMFFTPTINAECYHYGGYGGLVVVFLLSACIFGMIPTVASVGLMMLATYLLEIRPLLSGIDAGRTETAPRRGQNRSVLAELTRDLLMRDQRGTLH